jgi:hypothetical protein
MPKYSTIAWEREMKVQEVILRAMAEELTWWRAAEIIGISGRSTFPYASYTTKRITPTCAAHNCQGCDRR